MKPTQTDLILRHLKDYGPLTPLDALSLYGCFRLAARVNELKNRGVRVQCETIHRNGKRYAEYRL